jgi:rhodanese-related sulfurtransferase
MDFILPDRFLQKMEQNELGDSIIIDVREPYEWDYYHLDEAKLLPMNSIPSRLHEIPQDQDIYMVCAHGVRSAVVCNFLIEQGYTRVINVEGGMAAIAELRNFRYD